MASKEHTDPFNKNICFILLLVRKIFQLGNTQVSIQLTKRNFVRFTRFKISSSRINNKSKKEHETITLPRTLLLKYIYSICGVSVDFPRQKRLDSHRMHFPVPFGSPSRDLYLRRFLIVTLDNKRSTLGRYKKMLL